ncbi:unnamed protein product [Adineta ricciae]|nr:unnamed protein product [Adineta ricciae]
MAVTLGHTLLESNDSLRNQVALLEQDIVQTTEIVKQLKHDLVLKERVIRFYTDMEESELEAAETNHLDVRQYEQKIRHLEEENEDLRTETLQLKVDAENYEHQEQAIVDNFVNTLANANAEIDNLQQELIKKTSENAQQQDEIVRLSYEMREIRRRLAELKKENEELRNLLAISGKNRHDYETKIEELERNYSECLEKLHQSQSEVNSLQQRLLETSPSSSMTDLSSNRHTVFLSPVEYANFMGTEHSLKSELEEVLEDPSQLCTTTVTNDEPMTSIKKFYRTRSKRDQSDTDGESTMNDSAFSDTESLSSASSCPYCHRCSPISSSFDPKSSSTYQFERRMPTGISSRLKLVKRLEGSNMLKRWQELAEPSLSSCLQTIPGVYTRAEILHEVKEEDDDDEQYSSTPHNELDFLSNIPTPVPSTQSTTSASKSRMNLVELLTQQGLTARTLESAAPDPDDSNDLATPPSSPIHGAQLQTNALLHQVMQRLVSMSLRTFETIASSVTESLPDEQDKLEERSKKTTTVTPPSSPKFEGLTAPTPNTAMRAIKSSTFLRVSSLNPLTKAFATRSPGEVPSMVSDFLRGYRP